MKTKTIIDTESALKHYNENGELRMNQKELSEATDVSEQNLINWKNKAPKVFASVLKIQDATGAPLDVIIKEVPE